MLFVQLALGALATKFGRAPGNNPDSDETYPAWIAWRMSGALIAAGIGAALKNKGLVASTLAGFAAAFVATDIASKALETKAVKDRQ